MKVKNKIKEKWNVLMIIILIVLIIYTLLLFIPLMWGLMTSFKDDFTDFRNNIFGFPKVWRFDNYPIALFNFYVEVEDGLGGYRNVYMPEQLLNSIIYSTGCAFFATFIPCITGYLTAKFNYKFSKILTVVVIICITLPIVGSLPSQIQIAKALHLYDSMIGMWIMKANFLSMYLLIFQGMFKAVPNDFIEAAKIDGASNLKICFSIMLPLVGKTFLTVFLLNFIGFWNDYQTPLIFMPNKPTIAYGLYLFNRNTDGELSTIPMKLTGSMIVMLPILVLFFVFQKRLMGNALNGGLKG